MSRALSAPSHTLVVDPFSPDTYGSIADAVASLDYAKPDGGRRILVRGGVYREKIVARSFATEVASYSRATVTGVMTVTTSSAHGLAVDDRVWITGVDQSTAAGVDGEFVVLAVASTTQFTVSTGMPLAASGTPSAGTVYVVRPCTIELVAGAVLAYDTATAGNSPLVHLTGSTPIWLEVRGDGTLLHTDQTNSASTDKINVFYCDVHAKIDVDLKHAQSGSEAMFYASNCRLDMRFRAQSVRAGYYDLFWFGTACSGRAQIDIGDVLAADNVIELGASSIEVYCRCGRTRTRGPVVIASHTGKLFFQSGYSRVENGEIVTWAPGNEDVNVIDIAQADQDTDANLLVQANSGSTGSKMLIRGSKWSQKSDAANAAILTQALAATQKLSVDIGRIEAGSAAPFATDDLATVSSIELLREVSSSSRSDPALITIAGAALTADVTGGTVSETGRLTFSRGIEKTTTNNSAQVVVNLPLKDSACYTLVHRVTSRRTDSGTENSVHEHRYRIKVASGSVTVNSIGTDLNSRETLSTAVPTCVANGQSIDLKVTGEAGKTLLWCTSFELLCNTL